MEIKVAKEALQKTSIMVCTPMYGGICHAQYTKSMMDLSIICAKHGIQMMVYFLSNESLITRARAYAADEFMRSGCSHLMFIDSDIGFDPNDIIALLALTIMNPDYSIIGGPYPKKNISWEKVKYAVDKGKADEDSNKLENYVGDYVFNLKQSGEFRLDEPVEVSELGTGFMLIQRKVFEDMEKSYPELKYKPDHARTENFSGDREIMMFFDCAIDRGYSFGDLKNHMQALINTNVTDTSKISELLDKAKEMFDNEKNSTKRYLSEDYQFCYNAQKINHRTYLCPWMKLTHTGTHVFGGSLVDMLMLGINPTADETAKPKKKK